MSGRRKKKQKTSTPDKGQFSDNNSDSSDSVTRGRKLGQTHGKNKNTETHLLDTISEAYSCLYNINNCNRSPINGTSCEINMNTNANQSFYQGQGHGANQYTPLQSTPNGGYQHYPPPPPMPASFSAQLPFQTPGPSVETLLKELCNKMDSVETKLTKLDSIETRIDKLDSKFSRVEQDIKSCNDRINTLEHSAQFLSNAHDEQKALKNRIDKLSASFEKSKNVNNNVKERLNEVESQNLRNNLLFFAIKEQQQPADGNNAEMNVDQTEKQETTNKTENCIDIILDFCENQLNLENAKNELQIEKAYRLGKRKPENQKPRPIVVKFRDFNDREKVKRVSNRLKDTDYGISQHFPQDVLMRRRKLIPIMLNKRKENKKAHLVGDKLYVDGILWKE